MQLDRIRASLWHLGLDDSNYKVLKLLPLVYVAWADGRISPEQEERLVHVAQHHFKIGSRGEELLRTWIKKRPSAEYIREGLHDIVFLARAPDDWNFDVQELQGLISHAEAIARTSAEAMDAPTAIDQAEEDALHLIAQELGVDDGDSWAELIKSLS